MKNLLLDIGNSDIKIAVGGKRGIKFAGRYQYAKNKVESDLRKILSDKKNFNGITSAGASTPRGIDLQAVEKIIYRMFGVHLVRIGMKSPAGIKIRYSEGLGSDRICAAAAAAGLYNYRNILVIDFGTATTYTMICNKTLTGGMISPGIRTSLEALHAKTALPKVALEFPKNIFNDNTESNIRAGVLYQTLFTAERIITEMRKKYKHLFVISTGGYAELIGSKTKLIDLNDKHLVLKGINLILQN